MTQPAMPRNSPVPFSCPGPASEPCALERNLVVHVAALAAGADRHRLTRLRTGGAEIAATRLGAEVATAAHLVEHGELRVEALQHDLGRVAVLPVLVLPLAGLQRALEVHFRAFLDVLLDNLAQALVEDHHPVPLGLFAPLAGRLVAPGLAGGNAQIGDRPAVLRAADFRIRAQIADEDHLVDRTRHVTISCCDAPNVLSLPMRGHPSPKPRPQATPAWAREAPCSQQILTLFVLCSSRVLQRSQG